MEHHRYIILFLIGIMIGIPNVYAQWDFNLSYDQEYNNNPFRSPIPQESWVSTFSFNVQKGFDDLFVGYYGNLSYFNSITERNFYWHQLALWGGSDTTSWGIYGEQRINKSEYNIYDYSTATAFLRHRFFIRDFMLRWNGAFYLNQYKQLPELNNWKFNTNVQVNRSFQTRTTIIGGFSYNYKSYLNSVAEEAYLEEPNLTLQNFAAASIVSSTFGNGRRRQLKGNGNGYLSNAAYVNFQTMTLSQISFWIRLAQSLTQTTGLAVQYQSSRLLSGSDRYVSGLTHHYSRESQIFDDPMGYQSNSYGSELTQILPFSITLKLAAYYTSKDYTSQGIYLDEENYDDTTFRRDIYRTAWLNLRKNMGINLRGGGQIVVYLYYQWIENQSNSYWYDYSNKATSIGIEFGF